MFSLVVVIALNSLHSSSRPWAGTTWIGHRKHAFAFARPMAPEGLLKTSLHGETGRSVSYGGLRPSAKPGGPGSIQGTAVLFASFRLPFYHPFRKDP